MMVQSDVLNTMTHELRLVHHEMRLVAAPKCVQAHVLRASSCWLLMPPRLRQLPRHLLAFASAAANKLLLWPAWHAGGLALGT